MVRLIGLQHAVGKIRVVDPNGTEFVKFEAKDYLEHLEERVEPWSYQKVLYLKNTSRSNPLSLVIIMKKRLTQLLNLSKHLKN